MSLSRLFINRVSWRRKINTDTNEMGEIIYTEQLIASDVHCSRQVMPGVGQRKTLEGKNVGFVNSKMVKYYMFPFQNIRAGDIVSRYVTEQGIVTYLTDIGMVKDVRDAAGRNHHWEVFVEEIEPLGMDPSSDE